MPKVILFTGATDGIGFATVGKLAAQGHHLLVHGRNAEKLETLTTRLAASSASTVEGYCADLSSFADVDGLAEKIVRKHSHIDVVVNNAGVFKTDTPITDDGLDVRFVVNTIAPYLLTQRLLPLMNEAGRIVNLSSAAQAPVDLDALRGNVFLNDQFSVYAQSKLAITMWSRHLSLSLEPDRPSIIAINPGSMLASKMVKEGFGIAGSDLSIGVDILIRAGLSKEFSDSSGRYFDNDIGDFSPPHADAFDINKCEELVGAMDFILNRFAAL